MHILEEHGWTEVRRRKTTATAGNTTEEITFFVTNIPNGAMRFEFRKIFSRWGKLSDIYFGGHKGKNGKNYGFIRFTGVPDAKDLESKLNGVACRNKKLEINIARHSRKTQPPPPGRTNPRTRTAASTQIKNRSHGGGHIDHRTYTQVTGNQNSWKVTKNNPENHQSSTPVRLHVDEDMDRWLKNPHSLGKPNLWNILVTCRYSSPFTVNIALQ
ncbi:unnamed protein product [Lactuca virosa]|uniref:RRM domain-containing protein n=1 Tax=Lactuca virosa TaxID=75947 RepID=A0AAU9NUU7_9ASTR|nr:unnamed protein product [Lactuca virosa]